MNVEWNQGFHANFVIIKQNKKLPYVVIYLRDTLISHRNIYNVIQFYNTLINTKNLQNMQQKKHHLYKKYFTVKKAISFRITFKPIFFLIKSI